MPAPTLRLANASLDAPAVAAIYAPGVLASTASFEETPPDAAEMAARIGKLGAHYPWLVCERGGEVAGYAYAGPFNERVAYRWAVNVAVYVHPGHQRAGVARGLYAALFNVLKLQGFWMTCAGITVGNPGSEALHAAVGFRRTAIYENVGFKFGAWRSVGWWQLPLRTPAAPTDVPAEPLTMSVLRAHPDFPAALASGLTCLR